MKKYFITVFLLFVIVSTGYFEENLRVTDNRNVVYDYSGNENNEAIYNAKYWQGYNPSDNSISSESWYHIATLYDESYAKIYVDGVSISEYDTFNRSLKYSDTSSQIGLEYDNPSESCFNGAIDEIYIFDGAINESKVRELYDLITLENQSTVNHCNFDDAAREIRSLLSPYSDDELVIVTGSGLDFEDQMLFLSVGSQIDELKNIRSISDSEVHSTKDLDEKVLILIGSEKTNSLSRELVYNNTLNISKTLISSPFIVVLGSTNDNKTVLMLFTAKEFYNKENRAAERSPLSAVIDKKYVPIVATAISVILIYLWNIVGNTVSEFSFDFISERIKDKKTTRKKVKIKKDHKYKFSKYIDFGEIISIVLAVVTFSIAMSWTWSEDLSDFFGLFYINFAIISCMFILRESFRIYFSYRKKLETKHVFWTFGALLTVGSTILGNTFSLASYTVFEDKENVKKYGKMYFLISLLTYGFSILAFILNFMDPSVVLQMISVFGIMSLFIDMTPINPMDGYDIKKWNFRMWLFFYIIVIITYLITNFTAYIGIM